MVGEIRFHAFDTNCVGHQPPGLWAHPRDRLRRYKDLDYRVEFNYLAAKSGALYRYLSDAVQYTLSAAE